MKKIVVLMSLFLTTFSFGQTKEVQEWKLAHPNIVLIEEKDANAHFINSLEEKNQRYIIYKEEFTEVDIEAYNVKNNISISQNSIEEQDAIKIWKAKHPNVIIISAKEFNLLPTEKQSVLLEKKVLIYQGQELVLTDLNEYDAK